MLSRAWLLSRGSNFERINNESIVKSLFCISLTIQQQQNSNKAAKFQQSNKILTKQQTSNKAAMDVRKWAGTSNPAIYKTSQHVQMNSNKYPSWMCVNAKVQAILPFTKPFWMYLWELQPYFWVVQQRNNLDTLCYKLIDVISEHLYLMLRKWVGTSNPAMYKTSEISIWKFQQDFLENQIKQQWMSIDTSYGANRYDSFSQVKGWMHRDEDIKSCYP